MNRLSMTYYLGIIAITATSSSFYAMEQKQLRLSRIEKQLLSREVDNRGKDYLLKEINEERKNQFIYDEKQKKLGINRPAILTIKDTFYKAHAETDPLTKNIFDEIEIREKARSKHQSPTNKLGNRTEYCWLEENDGTLSAVRIKSHFKYFGFDQRSLTTFVENYSQQAHNIPWQALEAK